jgi:transcriptional regulator with XRE-family HTH domain
MEMAANTGLAKRIARLRREAGLTLDGLAEVSGVSRAMISKVERGEASPTATVLAKFANAFGVSLSSLFGETQTRQGSPFSPRAAQQEWRDPATGYVRRHVSPRGLGTAMEIVEVSLPPQERVMFDNCAPLPLAQFVWLLEGALEMTVSGHITSMAPGECLHMRLDQPIAFHNPGKAPARYAVVIETGARAR